MMVESLCVGNTAEVKKGNKMLAITTERIESKTKTAFC